jgi:hypothetical protein
MKALLLLSAVAAVASAPALNAQVTKAKPDSACTTYPEGRVECRVYRRTKGDSAMRGGFFFDMDSAMAKRAALGIEVRSTGNKRDTLGVFVDAVTPQGPAESAGIVEGDRIAAINGVDLRTSSADAEDSYTSGLAAHRLTREVQKLTPGARVNLRVYSGGRVRDVQVTAGKASEVMRLSKRFVMPMDGMMRFEGPGAAGMIYGPEMPMLRERLRELPNDQLLRQKLRSLPNDQLLREKLRNLPDGQLLERLKAPSRIQLRAPMRFKTLTPLRTRAPQIYKVETDQPGQPFVFDLDDEPFDFENEIEPVSADTIRDLAATTVRDARAGLEQLAAAGIA